MPSISNISNMDELKELFPDYVDYTFNWLFLSTSGVHGSYLTIDDLEKCIKSDPEFVPSITVLVVQPRTVKIFYGDLEEISVDDFKWLRQAVEKTIDAIKRSQEGNLPNRNRKKGLFRMKIQRKDLLIKVAIETALLFCLGLFIGAFLGFTERHGFYVQPFIMFLSAIILFIIQLIQRKKIK
jgi:hypothetical protein